MITSGNKLTWFFWIFLFLTVMFQLLANKGIPFVTASGYAACLVITFRVYLQYTSVKTVKAFLTRLNVVAMMAVITAFCVGITLVLMAEGYGLLKITVPDDVVETVMEDWRSVFFGLFMASVFITGLNYSFEKYKDYLVQEKELEMFKRKSLEMELSLLRSQLSPHFTFNILNNLQFLIRKDKDDALRLLERYSKVLRYYVYESQKESIPLEQEIAFLQEYFDLEIDRHVADLQISCNWNIPPNSIHITPFILSAFVENAFKHVLPDKTNAYFIRQSCELSEQGELVFEIANTFDESETASKKRGVGLKHVQERLALAYPGRYQLTLSDGDELYVARIQLKL
jgi:two-component system, LytTR family, sensor kinase